MPEQLDTNLELNKTLMNHYYFNIIFIIFLQGLIGTIFVLAIYLSFLYQSVLLLLAGALFAALMFTVLTIEMRDIISHCKLEDPEDQESYEVHNNHYPQSFIAKEKSKE